MTEIVADAYDAEYQVVHFHNHQDVYHLSRQILLDSQIAHGEHCCFYRLLSTDTDQFNRDYCSFATIIPRTEVEADVYLNVDRESLQTVLRYIQTGRLNGCQLSRELVDLAYVFGLTKLVSAIQDLV